MKMRAVVPARFQAQLEREDARRELADVQAFLDTSGIDYGDGAVEFTPLAASYVHAERLVHLVCLFANTLGYPIDELHGVLRLAVSADDTQHAGARFATMTFDFDHGFMGTLQHGEAMLVHVNVPAKGLHEDVSFAVRGLRMSFTDIRVTPHGATEL